MAQHARCHGNQEEVPNRQKISAPPPAPSLRNCQSFGVKARATQTATVAATVAILGDEPRLRDARRRQTSTAEPQLRGFADFVFVRRVPVGSTTGLSGVDPQFRCNGSTRSIACHPVRTPGETIERIPQTLQLRHRRCGMEIPVVEPDRHHQTSDDTNHPINKGMRTGRSGG